VKKTIQDKSGPAAPAPAAPSGKSRTPGKAAKPTDEFPDLFALFAPPEETAAPPASTTPGRGGTTGRRAPGEPQPESGSGRANRLEAGRVSETHSRSEGEALGRQEERPPPAADIFGEEMAAAQTGPQRPASGRARTGRMGRR
jgi:hypothetical protein